MKEKGPLEQSGFTFYKVPLQRVKTETSSFNRDPYNNMPISASCFVFETNLCPAQAENSVSSTIQSSSLAHGKQQANPKSGAKSLSKQHN